MSWLSFFKHRDPPSDECVEFINLYASEYNKDFPNLCRDMAKEIGVKLKIERMQGLTFDTGSTGKCYHQYFITLRGSPKAILQLKEGLTIMGGIIRASSSY